MEIDSIDQIPSFKGVIKGLVNEKLQKSMLVVDHGFATASIVCTKEMFGTSNHISLLALVKGPRFMLTMVSEFIASEDLIRSISISSDRRATQKLIPVIGEENKYIVFYDEIVAHAVNLSASDIHFEITNEDQSQIRLRIYGRLLKWKVVPTELLKGALTSAYSKRTKPGTNSGGALSFERAANTITEQICNGKTYNGRFNGYPLVNGYDVVMRLLDSDPKSTIPAMEALGYSKYHIDEQIMPAIRKNAGMMAIAGSTGSGKSTALRSFIFSIPGRDNLKIFGVEDPVEYLNPFMRQISVQRSSDDADEIVKMKFLSALRSVLRMDPDALMLGEIRDHDSASLASEFNRTGHRVFTTVHGDGCVDVLARLTSDEIGIHPSTLAAKKYLSAVMYQKLLPKLCPHCKVPAVNILPEHTISTLRLRFKVDPTTMYCANEDGCEHCVLDYQENEKDVGEKDPNAPKPVGIAGTKGLTVVAEILTPTDSILDAIRNKDWPLVEGLWRNLRQVGFDHPNMAGKTAFEHALFKACQGLVDPRDIEADFESFETYQIKNIVADE